MDTFASFCDEICTSIEGHQHIEGTDDHRVLLWDNLRAHYAPIVHQTVEERNGPTVSVFYLGLLTNQNVGI